MAEEKRWMRRSLLFNDGSNYTSGQSRCRICTEKIASGEPHIAVAATAGGFNTWEKYHCDCVIQFAREGKDDWK